MSREPGPLTRRILFRLESAEAHEPNPHLRDDLRIAWITVLDAARGMSQPDVAASYCVIGLHPQKVWPSIVAKRRAMLGPWYQEFFGGGTRAKLPPKKPPQSVRLSVKDVA